jgi:large subunit ribosomal protein L19
MNFNKTTVKISPVDVESRQKLNITPGNTVRVWQKIQEKGKTRLQAFEGLIIARKHGNEPGGTFTVRRVASGVGVEKIFPLYSPNIDRVELIKQSKVRRAKLYYIRDKAAKEVRRRMKQLSQIALSKLETDEPEEVDLEQTETEPEGQTNSN